MFVNTFIKRPILASVCSLVIILAGVVAIPTMPIAQFPPLAPPNISVTAIYTGANAQEVETAVTTPLEQARPGRPRRHDLRRTEILAAPLARSAAARGAADHGGRRDGRAAAAERAGRRRRARPAAGAHGTAVSALRPRRGTPHRGVAV